MIELNITSGKFDCRVKDNKFVYCAMEEVMEPMLARARSVGPDITTVIIKVIFEWMNW